ncbi:polyamine aminopropyltransferase [Mycoplasmatota bacterium]|nr:polyamine aminopropyltransferase [Mycoplasmatota bacterium]
MELWFTEEQTDNIRFSVKVKNHFYTEKSDFQQIDFFESFELGKFFTLDGIIMLTEKDEFIYHEMITHIPLRTNPSIEKVLVIGGGDGGTVRELTRYPHIKQIDLVEIDEMVVRTCKEFLPITSSKLEDERVHVYFEDGLKFVQTKRNEYDLIIVDSTDPIGPGEGLFSMLFYENCFKALNGNGILVNQHESPYYDKQAHEMKRVHSKIKKIFPISKVYQAHIPTYESGHWLFGFASKKYDPIQNFSKEQWESFGLKTKYYNSDLHLGAFALPTYVKDMLEKS